MRFIIYIAGCLAIAGGFTFAQLMAHKRNADSELHTFAATVRAPLTAEVRNWLGPQLARRSLYPTLGASWGLIAANIPLTPGWQEVPWYWFALLVGSGLGMTTGALLAGYRAAPLLDGPTRTVDPVRRRVADYFDHSHVLRLRLAVLVSGMAMVLAGAIAASGDPTTARRVLLGCGLAALLVAAHYWVAATVIGRPMVTSTPEGLLWQKALLAKTVEPMPTSGFLLAIFSAVIALFALVVTYRDLSPAVVLLGACVALLTAASAAAVVSSDKKTRHRLPVPAPTKPTAS